MTDNIILVLDIVFQGESESLSESAVQTPSIIRHVGVTHDVTVWPWRGFLLWEWRSILFRAVARSFMMAPSLLGILQKLIHIHFCEDYVDHFRIGLLFLCHSNWYHRAHHVSVQGTLAQYPQLSCGLLESRDCVLASLSLTAPITPVADETDSDDDVDDDEHISEIVVTYIHGLTKPVLSPVQGSSHFIFTVILRYRWRRWGWKSLNGLLRSLYWDALCPPKFVSMWNLQTGPHLEGRSLQI